jgi:stearoyl-CoA desaturase (Delta-9 desaturase)
MKYNHFYHYTIPVHLAALGLTWYAGVNIWLVLAFTFLCQVGVEVGTHRYFAHRAFKLSLWRVWVLAWLATIAGQGSIIAWAAVHRNLHHAHADTIKDPHSPNNGNSLFHAYIGWLYRTDSSKGSYRGIGDMTGSPAVMFFYKHGGKTHLALLAALLCFGLEVVASFYLAVVIALHINLAVNILCHKIGSRYYITKDNSRNLPLLSPVTMGLSLHNNHHGQAAKANFANRWWQLDLGYWVICLIRSSK